MTEDRYIRIGLSGVHIFEPPRHAQSRHARDALLFIDVVPGGDLFRLRDASYLIPPRLGMVLARSEHPAGDLQSLIESLGVRALNGTIRQQVQSSPIVEWAEPSDNSLSPEILGRARAAEFQALLNQGGAIWEPEDHHYRLPSGQHSGGFVRVADAIREPHDAEVLAMWMAQDLEPNVGILTDSPSLSGLVTGMHNLLYRAGLTPGQVAMLENYPRTQLDVERSVRHVSGSGSVIAILSVSSSGRARDRIVSALRALENSLIKKWRLHILVDRISPGEITNVETWLPLRGEQPFQGWNTSPEDCAFCKDPKRSRVFTINPQNFRGMIPAQLKLLVPSHRDAHVNRAYWEACSAVRCVELEKNPDREVSGLRPRQAPMGVHIDLTQLLENKDLPQLAADRLGSLSGGGVDLVLVPEHDSKRKGFSLFWDAFSKKLGLPKRVQPFPLEANWAESVAGTIAKSKSIVVFSLGIVTGASVQKALVAVQGIKKDDKYTLSCACLHGRPSNRRVWQTLENSYDGALSAAWLTFISERSPLGEELRLLSYVDPSNLSSAGREFFEERRLLCSGNGVGDVPLFWGSTPKTRLSPHSIFGEIVDPATILVAVGSSIHKARVEAKPEGAPEWRVFEIPAIVKSYYDPLILASVLRWLEPQEIWWGEEPSYGRWIVRSTLARETDLAQKAILVCECSLAVAQGKIPDQYAEDIRAEGEVLITQVADARPAIEFSMTLLEQALKTTGNLGPPEIGFPGTPLANDVAPPGP